MTGFQLSYAHFSKQDHGYEAMKEAFGVTNRNFITKIPDNYKLFNNGTHMILKYGDIEINPKMYDAADECGIVGYWDNNNFILISTEEYKLLIEGADSLIRKKTAKISNKVSFAGPHLLILDKE